MMRILLIALGPLIYTFLRLRKLLRDTAYQRGFTVLYVLLVLAFPVTESLSHQQALTWEKPLLTLGLYSVPFLLYLFLLVLLLDVGRGINGWLKLVSPDVLLRKNVRLGTVGLLFLFSLAIVVAGKINLDWIRTKEFYVSIPRQSSPLTHLKIVLAADLHLGELTDKHFLEKLVSIINPLNPDMVLLPGDVLEGHQGDAHREDFARKLSRLKAKYGVFASPGNHDPYGREDVVAFFQKAGIQVLADQGVMIAQSVYLVGRNDRRSGQRESLADLLKPLTLDLPILLMDHRPIDLKSVGQSRVALQVSGHTHNGQMFPLNLIVGTIYELSWGYRLIGNTHFFVTSGVQVWGPPVRTAGHSEIVVIEVDLRDKKKEI